MKYQQYFAKRHVVSKSNKKKREWGKNSEMKKRDRFFFWFKESNLKTTIPAITLCICRIEKQVQFFFFIYSFFQYWCQLIKNEWKNQLNNLTAFLRFHLFDLNDNSESLTREQKTKELAWLID